MTQNNVLNTILFPVVSACATASIALIVAGNWLYALGAVILTFAVSALYEFLP